MGKQIVAFDATMLSSLQGCARKTHFRFGENLVQVGGKSPALETGSLVHIILEYYNLGIIAGMNRVTAIEQGFMAGREYIRPYFPTNLYVKDETHLGMVNTPEESEGTKTGWAFVLKTMEEYFDFYKNESWTVLASEETKGNIIYEDDDIAVLWKAKFDAIVETNGGIMSMDHKTMKQDREMSSMNNQFMGQCVLLNARNMIVNKIGFQKTLPREKKFQRVIINYSTDRLAEWKNEIIPYYARQFLSFNSVDYYPPNFTQCETKYGYCDYKKICEVDRGIREKEKLIYFEKGQVWDV